MSDEKEPGTPAAPDRTQETRRDRSVRDGGEDDLEAILAQLPPKHVAIIRETLIEHSYHSGPLPSPETLEQYGKVVPGLAEKIVGMAEREQTHRHELEREDLKQDRREASRGQYLGFVTILLLIVAALLALWLGSWPVALGFLAPAVFQTVGKLVWRDRKISPPSAP